MKSFVAACSIFTLILLALLFSSNLLERRLDAFADLFDACSDLEQGFSSDENRALITQMISSWEQDERLYHLFYSHSAIREIRASLVRLRDSSNANDFALYVDSLHSLPSRV